jgi:hypothetical protein
MSDNLGLLPTYPDGEPQMPLVVSGVIPHSFQIENLLSRAAQRFLGCGLSDHALV